MSSPNPSSSSSDSIAPSNDEDEDEGHVHSGQESRAGDLFKVILKFGIGKQSELDLYTKYSIGRLNHFAFTLKQTGDLLLVSGTSESGESEDVTPSHSVYNSWRLRQVPWFDDPAKKITALSFDEESLLYIGTEDGTLYELNVNLIFDSEGELEPDLKQTFHLDECRITDILIWFRERTKIVICNGGSGKLIFIPTNSLPVLITFNSLIATMHLFINNAGLSSLLVCLQSNQNVTTVLDDLDVPPQEESVVKKSIFKRAKENIISRFGDSDKGLIFGRRTSRDLGIGHEIMITSAESVTSMGPSSQPPTSTVPLSLVTKSSSVNIKFTTLEELSSRGMMLKISGRNQFYRHLGSKLDVFEADFRQIASMSLPENISKLFVIEKIFYAVDSGNNSIRLSVIHNQMLKEFAIIPFSSKILSVEPAGEMGNMDPFSVFLISASGVFLVALKKSPLDICADMLMGETAASLFEVVVTALNVPKNDVYILAGDKSAEEGKFAKTILYYKVAGMTYSKIVAKFGSRRMIPAMLCFYDLVDNEKTRFTGNTIERNIMADIIIQGRIEQFLRHGTKNEPAKDPRNLLLQFLQRNEYYSSDMSALSLSYPQVLWAAKTVGEIRQCHSEILQGLHLHQTEFSRFRDMGKTFWYLLVCDWKGIYGAPPPVFCWFRELVLANLHHIESESLYRLCKSLMPWRRELLRIFFCDVSDLTESIDFMQTAGPKKLSNEDYVNLFIHVMLEIIKRNEPVPCKLFNLFYNWEAKKVRRKLMSDLTENAIATTLLTTATNSLKTFSASGSHCVCVRNGRLYSWGDNRMGRLGIRVNREKLGGSIEVPIPVNLSPSLKLVIDSVSCGQAHTVALTTAGTLLAFGSNKFGQLGIGPSSVLSESPVFPYIPNVTFICVAAGGYHTVGVDHLSRPWTWGWGIWGQLGNNSIENVFYPTRIRVTEKIVMASAGHSHTALLTISGKVLTFGCAHFGQLGHGLPNGKIKGPKVVDLPSGVLVRSIDCGLCSTIFLTMRNRIFYAGINPSSIRTMLSGSRKKAAEGRNSGSQVPIDAEEKDFYSPNLIDTSSIGAEIQKVDGATTHFAVLSTTGLVYSWGLGKNGQLMRADDDGKGLTLVDPEERIMSASDVICAGECSWIVEKESGRVFGFGFNSCGQLGKMETEQDSSILTIKTKKRVLRVRQPANVHHRPKEVLGLPRRSNVAETENSIMPAIQISPPSETVGKELLTWVLKTFHRNYTSDYVAAICAEYENHEGAATVHAMERDFEGVLQHRLEEGNGNEEALIGEYAETKDRESNCLQETHRFLDIVVHHWMDRSLPGIELEGILMPFYRQSPWNSYMSRALREMISETNDRSKWIAGNFSPSFILMSIRDSKIAMLEEETYETGIRIGGDKGQGERFGYEKPKQNGFSFESSSPSTTFLNGSD